MTKACTWYCDGIVELYATVATDRSTCRRLLICCARDRPEVMRVSCVKRDIITDDPQLTSFYC